MARGRVKHVIFDPNNPEHIKAVDELQKKSGELMSWASDKKLIQFFEGKPVGYIDFWVDKKEVDISHIYLLPEYRDTQPKKMTEEEKKKAEEFWDKVYERYYGKRRSEMPKRVQKKLNAIDLARSGLKKRETQLVLSGKMMRYLANRYGKPVTTPFARTSMGQKVIDVYMRPYTTDYFKRKSQQKPRPGRGKK